VGISPGENPVVLDLDRQDLGWYRSRSRRYSVHIDSLVKKGSLYPEQITDFQLDDSIDSFNPVESYGKLLPSLAKKHELAEFERYGQFSVPDAVLIIDSSGSMPDPDEVVSYAVLGAFAIARNYLDLGARLGVINFSNTNLELQPTAKREQVYRMLKAYQGHGTTLHLDSLEEYVKRLESTSIDYILITDAGIDNIRGVVEFLGKVGGRLSVIWLKSEIALHETFKDNYNLLRKQLPATVKFVEIENEGDIPRLGVGRSFCESYGIY
jgi:hypothetical protein